MKEVTPELVAGKSDWELMNLSTEEIMNLLDSVPEKSTKSKLTQHVRKTFRKIRKMVGSTN